MNTQSMITIEADKLSDQRVVEVGEAFRQISQGLIEIKVKKRESEDSDGLGDVITLAIILEPIVKAGMEFLVKEVFDWLKKKFGNEKKPVVQYTFNIYNTVDGGLPTTASNIGRAEQTVNRLLEPYLSARHDFKGSLFTLLGRGEMEAALAGIVGMGDDAFQGRYPKEAKQEALSVLEKIQVYKTAHPDEKQKDWDVDFRTAMARSVFECINLLPQDLAARAPS